jgi:hypothetical protein
MIELASVMVEFITEVGEMSVEAGKQELTKRTTTQPRELRLNKILKLMFNIYKFLFSIILPNNRQIPNNTFAKAKLKK